MRVKTISVSYGRKFNLSDFNSLNLEATLWCDLDEGEVAEDAIEAGLAKAKAAVAKEYLALRAKLDGQKAKGVSVAEKVQLAQ